MKGTNHVALGMLTGSTTAFILDLPPGQAVLANLFGALAATGPDMDLKWSGIWAHRRMTHWRRPWTVLGIGLAVTLAALRPGTAWVALVVTAGWLSHIAGDWAFGKGSKQREAGVPFTGPMSGYHGLGGKSGGTAEHVFTFAVVWPLWWATAYAYTELGPFGFVVLVLTMYAAGHLLLDRR